MCSHVALLEAMSCVAARLGLLELCRIKVRRNGQWQDGKDCAKKNGRVADDQLSRHDRAHFSVAERNLCHEYHS